MRYIRICNQLVTNDELIALRLLIVPVSFVAAGFLCVLTFEQHYTLANSYLVKNRAQAIENMQVCKNPDRRGTLREREEMYYRHYEREYAKPMRTVYLQWFVTILLTGVGLRVLMYRPSITSEGNQDATTLSK